MTNFSFGFLYYFCQGSCSRGPSGGRSKGHIVYAKASRSGADGERHEGRDEIMAGELNGKKGISEECKDFMVRLLKKIPKERIGFGSHYEL